jgi:hypothetical protein
MPRDLDAEAIAKGTCHAKISSEIGPRGKISNGPPLFEK